MAEFPEYKRTTGIKASGNVPDFQSAMEGYASASWGGLADLSAKVAQSASEQMAKQIGSQLGENPDGDLSPPITDFDKVLAQSYQAQSNATLSIQANKLLTDTSLSLSQDPNLTSDKVKSTFSGVDDTLNNLVNMAPDSIKSNLQARFAISSQNMSSRFQMKVYNQNQLDNKNNLLLLANQNTDAAYNYGYAGNEKAMTTLRESSEPSYQAGVNAKWMTPVQKKVAQDSMEQAYLSGKYSAQAKAAYDNKTLPQFSSDLVEGKIGNDIPQQMRTDVINRVAASVNQLVQMNSQLQSINLAKFGEKIATRPDLITGQDLADLQASVDPVAFEKASLDYLKAMEKNQASAPDYVSFRDAGLAANMGEKKLNNTFKGMRNALIKEGVNPEQAELMVMNQAGTAVPEFTNSVVSRIQHGSPDQMLSASRQADDLISRGKGNLIPLDAKTRAMKTSFLYNLRTPMSPEMAAATTREAFSKETNESIAAAKAAWPDQKKALTKGFASDADAAISLSGLPTYDGPIWNRFRMRNATLFGQIMMDRLADYTVEQHSDLEAAKQQLREDVSNSFGRTMVNGFKENAYLPIESKVGLPVNKMSAQLIKSDVARQLVDHLQTSKQLFDKGESNEYWKVEPVLSPKEIKDIQSKSDKALGTPDVGLDTPVRVSRVLRSGKVETYDVVIQASPYTALTNDPNNLVTGGYDISVQTPMGLKSLLLLDPVDQTYVYNPDSKYLQSEYMALHPIQKFAQEATREAVKSQSLAEMLTHPDKKNSMPWRESK